MHTCSRSVELASSPCFLASAKTYRRYNVLSNKVNGDNNDTSPVAASLGHLALAPFHIEYKAGTLGTL